MYFDNHFDRLIRESLGLLLGALLFAWIGGYAVGIFAALTIFSILLALGATVAKRKG